MAKLKAVIVDPDGVVRVTEIEDDLGAFQAIVGGYIEAVCSHEVTIYVNEEGLLQGLPFNSSATLFAKRVLGADVGLVGTALILGPPNNGNDTHVRQIVVDYYTLED